MDIDYRKPCGGDNIPSTILGGCYNTANYNVSSSVPVLKNTTQMKTYFASGPAYIAPYALANPSSVNCSLYYNYTCPSRTAPNGNVFCAPASSSDFNYSGSTFAVGPFSNSYTVTTQSKQINNCSNIGFKNAYASKAWHGKYAYNSRYNGQYDKMLWCTACTWHNYDANPDTTKYLSLSATSNLYKKVDNYTSTTTTSGTCCGGSVDNVCTTYTLNTSTTTTGTATNTVHIDKYSGNTIIDACSSSSNDDGTYASNAFDLLLKANGNINDIFNEYYDIEVAQSANITYTDTNAGSSHQFKCQITKSCYDACGNLQSETIVSVYDVTIDTIAGTLSIKNYSENMGSCNNKCICDNCCTTFDDLKETKYTIGATTYQYQYTEDVHPSHSVHIVVNDTMNATLSDAYTASEVNNEITKLLNYLPLDRDDLFPWRSDNKVTMGPYVHYDESLGIPSVGNCINITNGTGKIVGIPGPSGIDRVFNPLHKNYCICTDAVTGTNRCLYVESYGAYNDVIGGGAATCWTDDYQASNLVQGAFLSNRLFSVVPCTNGTYVGPAPSAEIWGGKYAEIIFPKQSFNYARPCGADRFAIDSNAYYCITGSSGNTVYTQNAITNIDTNDYAWICGVSGIESGCYKVTKTTNHKLSLTTLIASASKLPNDCGASNCGTGLIGKLKFQGTGSNRQLAPAICGYLDINKITGSVGNYITCSTLQPNYLITGDKVTIFSGSLLNGNYTVTALNSSSFALQSTNYSGAITSSFKYAYVRSQFASDIKWNDNGTKGDFTTIEFKYNYRDIAEYIRLAAAYSASIIANNCEFTAYCTPGSTIAEPRTAQKNYYGQEITDVICTTRCTKTNACGPSVAFYSPNAETFASGTFYNSAINCGWSSYSNFDEQYGTTWQAAIKQQMQDFYYQSPPCPCSAVDHSGTTVYECNGQWKSDNGSCQADVVDPVKISYYAAAPVYEARCEIPEGAPALISGSYIGCINPNGSTNFKNGNICSAPNSDAYGMYDNADGCNVANITTWETPWIDEILRTQCSCDSGRFSSQYISNGFNCQNPVVPAP